VIGMCDGLGQPSSVTAALGMLDRALHHLNATDAASLPASVQAEVLRALERAGAKHTAARSRMLAAFAGQAAYEDDGQGSAGTWLKWQTRVTKGAAAGAVGWAHRLAAHQRSGMRCPRESFPSHGPGRSAPGPTACLPPHEATRMRSWPRPPAAV